MRDVPDSFCLMPWIHAHVSAQGHRKLCCIDERQDIAVEADKPQSIKEFWNSKEIRSVRRAMLAGVLPPRCINCSPSGNRATSFKDQIRSMWADQIGPAIASTAPDGSTSFEPFTFDYRSSTCNLRCRICSPHASTSAELEANRHAELREVGEFVFGGGEAYAEIRAEKLAVARNELMDFARERRIRHLYWAGGEPLMDETHWAVMSELVSSGASANVEVAYNTNLTVFSYRGQKVEDIWPHFRQVHVQASIDGIGEAGEYIRTGFKTEVFARHLDALRDMARRHAGVSVALDLTLTSVGLLHLADVMEFALERQVPVTAKLMVPRELNRYMAVEFLPRAVKDDWCRKWMAWIELNDSAGLFATLYDTLDLALERDSLHEDGTDIRTHNAYHVSVIAAFESVRKDLGGFRRLLSVDPRLVDFSP